MKYKNYTGKAKYDDEAEAVKDKLLAKSG